MKTLKRSDQGLTWLLAACLVLGLGFSAVAQPPAQRGPGGQGGPGGHPGPGGPFGPPPHLEMLEQADTDGDGQVSKTEFTTAWCNNAEKMFARFDQNGDGALTPDDRPERGFGPGGGHGPGMQGGRPGMRGPRGGGQGGEKAGPGKRRGGGQQAGPGQRGPGMGGRPGMGGGPDMMRRADTDEDGKVTLEEMKAAASKMTEERFKQMDQNGDGVLTEDDRPQGKPGMGRGGRGGGRGGQGGGRRGPQQ
jgi:hypothetical protein